MTEIEVRPYEAERDLKAVRRTWREVGWVTTKSQSRQLPGFLAAGECLVACIDGEAECAVHTTPGLVRHLRNDLSLCVVSAVTTSRVGRKLGLAGRLTAQALANSAAAGHEVAALGMFEQGFYDRLGFGTGAYEHEISFDPSTLQVPMDYRTPKRLTRGDWPAMQKAMAQRQRGHGGVVLTNPAIFRAELGWLDDFFALGYYHGEDLTHFLAGEGHDEHGPYRVEFMAYRTNDQLLELLALIKALGDQVSTFVVVEPPELQLQDLLRVPFRQRRATEKSDHENKHRSVAYWQMRVLDVPGCLEKTELPWADCSFQLSLTDPLADRDDLEWQGVQGDYVVSLGASSSAERGGDPQLPTLTASVGAFTRMWLGVRGATSLALTDRLAGPTELLSQLDEAFRLPRPSTTWDF